MYLPNIWEQSLQISRYIVNRSNTRNNRGYTHRADGHTWDDSHAGKDKHIGWISAIDSSDNNHKSLEIQKSCTGHNKSHNWWPDDQK